MKKIYLLILIIIFGSNYSFSQVTYTGSPLNSGSASCPTSTESCGSTSYLGNTVKAYVQSVNGSTVTLRLTKCDGSNFGTSGLVRVMADNICGTQIASKSVEAGIAFKDISFTVNHTGTKYYRLTYQSQNGAYYYTNAVSVTGTVPQTIPPTLKIEPNPECINLTKAEISVGEYLDGTIRVRNAGTQTYSGTITIFISLVTSPGVQEIIREQSYSILPNGTQTIAFYKIPSSAPGVYRLWIKYTNYPPGNNGFIENNNCNTCQGIGCLSVTTPTALVTIKGAPKLTCGNMTVSPAQPVKGENASFSYTISNTGTANFPTSLRMMWRKGTVGQQLGNSISNLDAGQSYTFTHNAVPVVSEPGVWKLSIEDGNGNIICSNDVTVKDQQVASCVSGTGNQPDVNSDEYKATQYLCQNNIIAKQQNWTTNATEGILRQDIAKVVYLGLYKGNTPNSPAVNFPVPFLDMQSKGTGNEYWFDAAKVLAYLQYNDDNTPFDRDFINFRPDERLQRQHAIKLFLEAFNIKPSTNTISPYSDVDEGNEWFGYIRAAYDLGLMTGSGGVFRPGENITRQEAFIVLWRILTFSNVAKPTSGELNSLTNYYVPGNYRVSNFANVPDLAQGNFNHYQKTSFSISGRSSIPLEFTHTYNSYLTELPKGYFEDVTSRQSFIPLGRGWTHTYNIYAIKTDGYSLGGYSEPAKILFYYPDGSIVAYNYSTNTPLGTGIYDVMTRSNVAGVERVTITTKDQTRYVFENINGGRFYFIKSIKDRNNNGVKITWENYLTSRYRISTVQEEFNNGSTGRSISFHYKTAVAGMDYLSSITDNSIGRTISFNVDIKTKNLTQFTDAKGQTTQYLYDNDESYTRSNLLTQIILPKGNKIKNSYDQRKLKSSQTFAQNGTVTSTTNVDWKPNYADASNPLSNSTVKDPKGRTTSYQYNSLGNAMAIQSPSGNIVVNSLDNNNPNLPTSISINGLTSTMSYDAKGNLLSVSNNGITNSYSYNSFNDVTSHIDGRGNTTNYNYDGNGNLIKISRPGGGGAINIARNNYGQVLSVTNPAGIQTSYNYNANGLATQINLPLGINTSATYDNASRLLTTTDANGNTNSYQYDVNDNVITTTDASGNTIQHTYDANGNHLTIKNPKGEIQTNSYNFDDDLLASETFGPHTKTYTYNEDGSLASYSRGNGTFIYTYDNAGRLINDGQTQYTYDVQNNIKTIKNGNGIITLNYDIHSRISSYTDYFGQTVAYGYDNNNNVISITYPGNKKVVYTYDALNRCTTVTDWNGKKTQYTYLIDDRFSQITLPNGTYTTLAYDAAGRPTGLANKRSDGSVISEYSFTLDKAGNHLSETINEPSINNALASIKDSSIDYGNYSYNRISSQGSLNIIHNAAGAITQKAQNSFTYDLNDNLLTVAGGLNASFGYDGAGNRREKTVNGTTTRYVLDIIGLSKVLMEMDASNNAQYFYVYGPTGLLYRTKVSNNTNQYYHYDFRGSTTAITNEAQTITHSYSYDPFGNILSKTETDFNAYRYVGQHGVAYESDDLVFMRARYYDPTMGRFLSEDPVWAMNLYPYADNNPITKTDPKGENWMFSFGLNRLEDWSVEEAKTQQEWWTQKYIDEYLLVRRGKGSRLKMNFYLSQAGILELWINDLSRATIKAFAPGIKTNQLNSITKVFGQTGYLKWLDMRTVEGRVLKTALGKFKDVAIDYGQSKAYDYIEARYGKTVKYLVEIIVLRSQ